MNKEYVFELPDHVLLPRKTIPDKRVLINMNTYQELHGAMKNQIKQAFKPSKLPEFFTATKISISYEVFKKTKRRYDTMNVVSVVDKFFLDWLVIAGYIPDDTCLNVQYSSIVGQNQAEEAKIIATITVLEE